jgi:3-deoxy-7-phosphoheptulonate synthase
MLAATHSQSFLGNDPDGKTSIVRTRGNPDVHVILRGGNSGPNHDAASVAAVRAMIGETGSQARRVMIDCSHGNSAKDFRRQPAVFREVMARVARREPGILGLMLESHLVEGRQPMGASLVYGQSITDGCIGWEETLTLLRGAHDQLSRQAA